MNKMHSRLLSQIKIRQNSSEIFNSQVRILSKPSTLSDHVRRKEHYHLPENISIHQIDTFELEDLESDEIEFSVNAYLAFTKRMKLGSIELAELGVRLKIVEIEMKNTQKKVLQMRRVAVNLVDRIKDEIE